ncbi:hypothetical protein PanWU01x14_314420 [Parasponia andersonii]|uniref:Transmembrane protein n=1 Tax=Parasponia andersonii TaxID=3476 RepID=A0A2P5ANP0_PARAD|nr:hypothetical protein PanWU01x14_314420 [Parasponia andersonii]
MVSPSILISLLSFLSLSVFLTPVWLLRKSRKISGSTSRTNSLTRLN